MSIQILSKDVVAQIAAGEVVERPSSVVKELIENALDAGAKHITVGVSSDGRKRIQVVDDGCGIHQEEVEVAFARHATSKLRAADDLYRIETLGFRGEALASIASVSHVTMTTRHLDERSGTYLRIEGGERRARNAVGAPNGTTLTIENLFYNTPARLKFLKNEASEKRHIATLLTRYAMAYPGVRFIYEQDAREAFRTTGGGSLLDVIVAANGLDGVKNMFEVDDAHDRIRVSGYTSAPSFNRSDRSRITLFVNGRWIQDTSLTYAVVQAYHTLLMTGRYPVAILMVEMPPEDLDVNVHPTKAEVRFRDPDAIFSAVQRAVRRAVIDHAQSPSLRSRAIYAAQGEAVWNPERESQQMGLGVALESPGQPARRQHENGNGSDDSSVIPYGANPPTAPRTLPLLRVVGQIASSYIIAEAPAGMYMIDQHAAHERILYEQFMAEYARQGTITQYALEAQTIQVAPDEAALLEANADLLTQFGFTLEPFGPNVFVVRGVPAMLTDKDPVEVIAGIVMDIANGMKPGQSTIEAKIVLRVCKQAAVKVGQVLSIEQMQGIIRQLERCESPLTCPHGRPTMIHMSSDELAREFGRMG